MLIKFYYMKQIKREPINFQDIVYFSQGFSQVSKIIRTFEINLKLLIIIY